MLEKIDKLPVSIKDDIDTFINNLSQGQMQERDQLW